MVDEVDALIRIAHEAKPPPIRACGTCRYVVNPTSIYPYCSATGKVIISERRDPNALCGPTGKMWEPPSPRVPGIFVRIWRFLFGYAPP